MKKCLIMAIVCLFMFAIGITAEASDVKVAVGAETEVMFNKEISLDNLAVDADLSAEHYDVVVDVLIGDWLKISPKAGISHLSATIGTPIGNVELNSGIGWNAGVDIDAKVLTTPYVDLRLISSYRGTRVGIDKVDVAGITINNPLKTIVYQHEFEIGPMISKDLSDIPGLEKLDIPFEPYVGVIYSHYAGNADVNLSIVSLNEDISGKRNVGLRCGLRAEPITDLLISLDAKFVDETALAGGVIWKF